MDPETLHSFRAQIHDWIKQRIEAGRYPFRRVETCPELFCEQGVEIPDLVLWINRSSCLAGAVLLMPSRPDTANLRRGKRAAEALGLTYFVLWSARDVSIWSIHQLGEAPLETLELPALPAVTAQDFEATLDHLLSRLKLFAVSGLMARADLPPAYFANLCRLALDEVLPAQWEVSRISADGTCSDHWAERASRDKAWLTLWRLLLLLAAERLPPSLQPHRLEQVMTYAFDDIPLPPGSGLVIDSGEPALSAEASVCFFHLGNRLKQLGWGIDRSKAADTIAILLRHAANFFGIFIPPLLPPGADVNLTVHCAWPHLRNSQAMVVAAAPYRAGMDLGTIMRDAEPPKIQATSVTELPGNPVSAQVIAYLADPARPAPEDRSRRLLKLREVWPNHRFSLPPGTPTWVWEGLHLTGLLAAPASLRLILGPDWAFLPGVEIFWDYLLKRHLLASGAETDEGLIRLTFVPPGEQDVLEISRRDGPVLMPRETIDLRSPSLLHFYLKCHREALGLVQTGQLRPCYGRSGEDLSEPRLKEIFLFLHSSLGLHILQHQKGAPNPPSLDKLPETLTETTLLLPTEDVFAAFAVLDWNPGQKTPERHRLDRILHSCWGKLPAVGIAAAIHTTRKAQRQQRHRIRSEVEATVFVDGIPRFPEDYLRQHFRPELQEFSIPGLLEPFDSFFGKFFLRTADGSEIQTDHEATARALLVASRLGRTTVQLPNNPALAEQILVKYLDDMNALWRSLVRECRRQVPTRTRALSLARRIWKERGLPGIDSLKSDLAL